MFKKYDLKSKDSDFIQVLSERDQAVDMADQLAAQISKITGHQIGQHTDENNPWHNALKAANDHIVSNENKPTAQQRFDAMLGKFFMNAGIVIFLLFFAFSYL
jgi:hypothetical protein